MPCLNEADSIAFCVDEAAEFLRRSGVDGEILIADNGSSDGSADIARAHGARVVSVTQRGYGSALTGGIADARGRFVLMGDCDGSYCFADLEPFLTVLRDGAELVVGNRYEGGFEQGSSPFTHRLFGVPLLSAFGRLAQRRFHPPEGALVRDFHCGLRAVRRTSFLALGARASGMEFASEMILLATRAGHDIRQVPAVLRRDLRGGAPHLRAVPDAMRHLRLIGRFLLEKRCCVATALHNGAYTAPNSRERKETIL